MNNYLDNSRNNGTNSCLQAAAKAAAQINAQLVAEGKLQQQSFSAVSGIVKKKDNKLKPSKKDLFSAEVEINDLPPRVRNLLTKGYIQEQIQWKSKAALCTKGRYIPHTDKSTSAEDRPLYLCIQAIDKQAVDEAIHHIHQFIAEHTNTRQTTSPMQPVVLNQPPPELPLIQDKVYINLDHAPPAFNLLQRVLGTDATNVTYIQSETGVNVSLRGQGQLLGNDEPLHLFLEHVDANAIQNARSLALSLVGTLQQDFVQWQREQQSQQQLIYAISQPFYNGSTAPNNGFHYPAVAMLYGMENNISNPPPAIHAQKTTKRLSRFDFQQPPGRPTDNFPLSKRRKTTNLQYS